MGLGAIGTDFLWAPNPVILKWAEEVGDVFDMVLIPRCCGGRRTVGWESEEAFWTESRGEWHAARVKDFEEFLLFVPNEVF